MFPRPRHAFAGAVVAVIVLGGLSACGSPDDGDAVGTPPAGTWELVEGQVGGEPIPLAATVTLAFQDDELGGTAGCNSYFAGASLSDDTIEIDEIGQTMMACDDAVMATERAYLDALAQVDRITVTDGQLTLRGDDAQLVFRVLPM